MNAAPMVQWQCPPKTVLVAVDFGDASAGALAIAGVVASAKVLGACQRPMLFIPAHGVSQAMRDHDY